MLIKKPLLLALMFNSSILTPSAMANSTMETYYLQNACHSCHGIYGEGIGASPKLQGVRKEVLLRRLKDLKKGIVRSASGFIMVSFAKAMDENQTIEMAKYLSNLETKVEEERYIIEDDRAGHGGS